MITRYIWRMIALSVSIDIVFSTVKIVIEHDVTVVGGSAILECESTITVKKTIYAFLQIKGDPQKIAVFTPGTKFNTLNSTSKVLLDSNPPSLRVNFTSIKCSDANVYECDYLARPRAVYFKSQRQLIVIDNSPSVMLQATSQCSGNDCSKCGAPGFTGPVLRMDEEMTFECSKEMAFHGNVTNYFKWFIYGSGGWVEEKKTTQQSTTNVNKNVKKGTCLANEYTNGTMSYTPKKTDLERMKVKCVAEMHIYGKLKDSKEKLLDQCLLGGVAPTVDPLANLGNVNVGGVVGVVAIAVGIQFY